MQRLCQRPRRGAQRKGLKTRLLVAAGTDRAVVHNTGAAYDESRNGARFKGRCCSAGLRIRRPAHRPIPLKLARTAGINLAGPDDNFPSPEYRSMRVRNSIIAALLTIGAVAGAPAQAETIVRYGISMADIPLTTGQPDRGAGAYQFTGYTIYDPLVAWEMDVADRPGKLVPGLATEWKVDDSDKKKWRFALRQGVKFHDGSDFNADAVVWNLDKVLNDKAPQFDKRQSAQVKTRLPSVASYAKLDDSTIEITTKTIDSFFPYQMLWFLISSPAQYEKLGKDWDKFASQPSGTGPFKLTKLVPRELAELTKNADYWNEKRIPKTDKLILIPMPEALTRTNALLAGQVDLIETPAPDAVPQLKSAGMRIVDNITPHVWNYHLSVLPGSPWTDVRLRKALNLAIDREAVVGLMNGLAKPAKGQVDPSSPWFGKPGFEL